ncbi:MAG: PD40 domain-containing protein, partial [Bacteroidaceae bacterium]|nr:PD40 domain-containing protein [Bacteroidaceae bacterium]
MKTILRTSLALLIVFVAFAAVMWWRGAYNFCYQEQWQTFIYDSQTVQRMLAMPGGVAEVIAVWLRQFFVFPLAGILIMALLLTVITAVTNCLIGKKGAFCSFNALAIVPATALMVLHYNINYMGGGTIAMLLMLTALYFERRITRHSLRLAYALIVACVLFVVAGAIAMFYAVMTFALYLIEERGRKKAFSFVLVPLLVLVLACAAYHFGYVGDLKYVLLPDAYYNHFLPANAIIYLPWAATAIVLLIGAISIIQTQVLNVSFFVAACAFLAFCAIQYINPNIEKFKETCCKMDENNMDEQIENYELMNKQTPYFKAVLAEMYFHLGENGAAMRYTFEANQSLGNRSPRLLKLLVRANIVMGEYEVAKKYLTILSHTLYYKDWAHEQMALIRKTVKTQKSAPIFPDYANVTVPQNIAPLCFSVTDEAKADDVSAVFKAKNVEIAVAGKDGFIEIPTADWQQLTALCADIKVRVQVLQNKVWREYNAFTIHVSADKIDSHLAYRLIEPGYQTYNEMGLYQRCLENFEETEIITNRSTNNGCLNCHSFHKQNPKEMLFHMRVDYGGTYRITAKEGGNAKYEPSSFSAKKLQLDKPLVYPSWHPSGNFVAFSRNNTQQIAHPTDKQRVEVFDNSSDVVVLDINNGNELTSPLLSSETAFETFPTFSADGKTLYFCTADSVNDVEHNWQRVKYSLCSIAFDPKTGNFGNKIDTLVNVKSAKSDYFNKSVSFPRVSPDGRFLMFTLHSCGNFSIWHRDADLHLADLKTANIRPLSILN